MKEKRMFFVIDSDCKLLVVPQGQAFLILTEEKFAECLKDTIKRFPKYIHETAVSKVLGKLRSSVGPLNYDTPFGDKERLRVTLNTDCEILHDGEIEVSIPEELFCNFVFSSLLQKPRVWIAKQDFGNDEIEFWNTIRKLSSKASKK